MKRFDWPSIRRRWPEFYLGGFSIFVVVSLLRRSIVANDTDLWYHLNAGRYIWERHALPTDSFFSFLAPPRQWIDYYWLFQAVVYRIFSTSGYAGLIIWRSALFALLAAAVSLYVLRSSKGRRTPLYACFLGACCLAAPLPRYDVVRPHEVSYLFIVVFLYILEFAPDLAFLLPILAVLWVNFHGVTYPVLLAICGAYLLDYLLKRWNDRGSRGLSARGAPEREDLRRLVPIALSMFAILCSPHGTSLIDVPFKQLAYATRRIGEFQPLQWSDLISLQVRALVPTQATFLCLLFVASLFAGLTSIFRRQIRASHLVLWACGAYLLSKGNRFIVEFALLSLPLAAANPFLSLETQAGIPGVARISLLLAALAAPFLYVRDVLPAGLRYPLAPTNLPQGVAAFLRRTDSGGSVLNDPSTGGYLQWSLYPRYAIAMDLEMPFLFSSEDFYAVEGVFSDERLLNAMLTQYQPAFISARFGAGEFEKIIARFPDFVPVFFDDNEILYASRKARPQLVRDYEWKGPSPWQMKRRGGEAFEDRKDLEQPLRRMLSIDPDCGTSNDLLARILMKEGRFAEALPAAENIIRNYPESAAGFELKADALEDSGADTAAIRQYRLALLRSSGAEELRLHKYIGMILFKRRDYERAYANLKEGLDLFSQEAGMEELYAFGASALQTGRDQEAVLILRFLLNQRVPAGDVAWRRRVENLLANDQHHEEPHR